LLILNGKAGEMKKIFIALLMLGFLSSCCFAADQATVAATDTTKATETKPVKKAKKKAKVSKKSKKEVKKEAVQDTGAVKQ